MAKITVVVPCYNEQQSLQQFYTATQEVFQSLPEHHFTYFFVNDGSCDDSLNILRALAEKDVNVNYISFSRNFGKEAALIAGLDFADGEAVITMDADLQHPPKLIPEMVKYWQEGYEDVCAKRADRKSEGFVKRHLTNFFYTCMEKFSKLKMQRNVGDFRLLDRRCVEALKTA
jgi:glycosyltransferase involved in cell wall biosynthesis